MKTILTISIALLLLSSTLSFASGWTYTKTVDEMNDNTAKTANVLSKDRTARLWVRCTDDGRNVINYNNFEFFIITSNVTDTTHQSVVFRIDKNKPVSVETSPSTNRRAEFVNNSSDGGQEDMLNIINQLKAGNTVKVKVGMFVGNARIYKFGLSGSTKTINKVMEDCKAFY